MGPKRSGENSHVRARGAKACRRCRRRKTLCEGAYGEVPCARCRHDNITDCVFAPSRRGKYLRKRGSGTVLQSAAAEQRPLLDHAYPGTVESSASILPHSESPLDSIRCNPPSMHAPAIGVQLALPEVVQHSPRIIRELPSNSHTECSQRGYAREQTLRDGHDSLAAMFEKFLSHQKPDSDRPIAKYDIVFLGEASPLTFALKEFQSGERPNLHNASISLHFPSDDGTNTAGSRQNKHPEHLEPAEIIYLDSKGAFELPNTEALDALVAAFLERFCPFYSIVNKAEFEDSYRLRRVPWILLHAVCFLGASYCDEKVISLAGVEGRWHARRRYFEKAKILFDVGYETDKIVLLQAVLALTFWGPRMKSFWNPCSWVGFAVTIAESLGIHQADTSAHLRRKDRGTLRRLWWTLTSRDAYCASLLGRPFRINIAQCDTEMLTLEDFDDGNGLSTEHSCIGSIYQIQSAKLFLISRQIVASRFGSVARPAAREDLHKMLDDWLVQLPQIIDWRKESNSRNVFVVSLEIIFYHQFILVYLGIPTGVTSFGHVNSDDAISAENTEFAARMILSSSLPLVASSEIEMLPQEVFSGFFIAGIVFYRQIRQPNTMLAQLGRSALNNCQTVIYQAREHWDTSQWVLKIFDFLLSKTDHEEHLVWPDHLSAFDFRNSTSSYKDSSVTEAAGSGTTEETLDNFDMGSSFDQSFMKNFNDFFMTPNCFLPLTGEGIIPEL